MSAMPKRAKVPVFTRRTKRRVSIASTTQSAAYAMKRPWMSSSGTGRRMPSQSGIHAPVTKLNAAVGASSAPAIPSTATIHIVSVAPRPMRASLRLPAAAWADPGIRKLSTTSHQPRRVMTSREPASG